MNYLNEDLCLQCQGACCKRMPGAMMPDDIMKLFPASLLSESLYQAFYTKTFVIDWWEGDPREDEYELDQAYYIRPKNDDEYHPGLFSRSFGGKCWFLNPGGCKLEPEMRPYTCRMLEPGEDEKCILHSGGKHKCAIAWLEYESILLTVAEHIQEDVY